MFFKNYYTPGSGIDKTIPPKKGIALYFDLLAVDFWGFIGLNMLYVICCIPIITIGGATLAFTELNCKLIRNENVFILSDFFDSFKNHFRRGLIFTVLLLLVLFDLLIIYTNLMVLLINGSDFDGTILWSLALILSLFITSIMMYLVTIVANIDLDFIFQLKNAFILMIVGGWRTLAISIFSIAVFVLVYSYFPFSGIIMFIFGFYILIFTNCFFIWPLIDKYIIIRSNEL